MTLSNTVLPVLLVLLLANVEAYGQQQTASAADFSEETIQAVANAYVAIREIRRDYRSQLKQIDDPAEAASLRKERQAQINEAVRDEDLTWRKYEEVTEAAQSNRDLYQNLREAIRMAENGNT